MSVKVTQRNRQKEVEVNRYLYSVIRKACNAVLSEESKDFSFYTDNDFEVNVTYVDDSMIHELNREYRNVDRATDVLSFPLGENGEFDLNYDTGRYMLGDVVISLPHALKQSEEYGHSFMRETVYLCVHSMLHLLGYDHINGGEEQRIMRNKEETVMDSLGLRR